MEGHHRRARAKYGVGLPGFIVIRPGGLQPALHRLLCRGVRRSRAVSELPRHGAFTGRGARRGSRFAVISGGEPTMLWRRFPASSAGCATCSLENDMVF